MGRGGLELVASIWVALLLRRVLVTKASIVAADLSDRYIKRLNIARPANRLARAVAHHPLGKCVPFGRQIRELLNRDRRKRFD